MTVYALDGAPRDYAWGSRTLIQDLLGQPSDGPLAELWFGDHAGGPARLPALDTTLDQLVADDPVAALGAETVYTFGPNLPYLLKILAADKALSIQVHPSREQARAQFAAGDPNYTDANHKPELLCALTSFEALCGFRAADESAALFDAVGLGAIAALLRGPDGIRAAFTAVLRDENPQQLAQMVASRAGSLPADAARAVALAAGDFPGDIGVVVTLLLGYVRLAPGEAIYLAAGNVHAYLRGMGVEIMAASDNVLRCGLTPKRIDVAELLKITDFTPLAEPRWPRDGGAFVVPVPDFRLALDPAAAGAGPRIVLCVEGTARVGEVEIAAGHAAFVPAGEQPAVTGRVFVAAVG